MILFFLIFRMQILRRDQCKFPNLAGFELETVFGRGREVTVAVGLCLADLGNLHLIRHILK